MNGKRTFYVRTKDRKLPSSWKKNQPNKKKDVERQRDIHLSKKNKIDFYQTRGECLLKYILISLNKLPSISCCVSLLFHFWFVHSDGVLKTKKREENDSLVNIVKPIFTFVTLLRWPKKARKKEIENLSMLDDSDQNKKLEDRCLMLSWMNACYHCTTFKSNLLRCETKANLFCKRTKIKIDWITFIRNVVWYFSVTFHRPDERKFLISFMLVG